MLKNYATLISMSEKYPYEMIILFKPGAKYIEEKEEESSFRRAFFNVLKRHDEIRKKIVYIYCKKPKSGDLKYMGKYDGESIFSSGIRYTLDLSDGTSYFLTEEGFKPLFDYYQAT